MCVIERRTYFHTDGRQETIETVRPCYLAVRNINCRHVERRSFEPGRIVIENDRDRYVVTEGSRRQQRMNRDLSRRSSSSTSTSKDATISESTTLEPRPSFTEDDTSVDYYSETSAIEPGPRIKVQRRATSIEPWVATDRRSSNVYQSRPQEAESPLPSGGEPKHDLVLRGAYDRDLSPRPSSRLTMASPGFSRSSTASSGRSSIQSRRSTVSWDSTNSSRTSYSSDSIALAAEYLFTPKARERRLLAERAARAEGERIALRQDRLRASEEQDLFGTARSAIDLLRNRLHTEENLAEAINVQPMLIPTFFGEIWKFKKSAGSTRGATSSR